MSTSLGNEKCQVAVFEEGLDSGTSYQVELNLLAARCVKPLLVALRKYFHGLNKQMEDQRNPTWIFV